MQDHGIGQTICRSGGRPVEALAIDLGHDNGRFVANSARAAVVLVGAASLSDFCSCTTICYFWEEKGRFCVLQWGDIERAVAKGAEDEGGIADVGLVGEHNLEDRNIFDDGGGNGGYEEED